MLKLEHSLRRACCIVSCVLVTGVAGQSQDDVRLNERPRVEVRSNEDENYLATITKVLAEKGYAVTSTGSIPRLCDYLRFDKGSCVEALLSESGHGWWGDDSEGPPGLVLFLEGHTRSENYDEARRVGGILVPTDSERRVATGYFVRYRLLDLRKNESVDRGVVLKLLSRHVLRNPYNLHGIDPVWFSGFMSDRHRKAVAEVMSKIRNADKVDPHTPDAQGLLALRERLDDLEPLWEEQRLGKEQRLAERRRAREEQRRKAEDEGLAEEPPRVSDAATGRRATKIDKQLFKAMDKGDLDKCESLIARGASVDARFGKKQGTLLYNASFRGATEVVELLLARGATVNALSSGFSALFVASSQGHDEVVKALLSHGADVNLGTTSPPIFTPLQIASVEGHPAVAEALASAGADLNATLSVTGASGVTALHLASNNGYVDIVNVLLSHGADIDLAADDGATAESVALQKDYWEIADSLQSSRLSDEQERHLEPQVAEFNESRMVLLRGYEAGAFLSLLTEDTFFGDGWTMEDAFLRRLGIVSLSSSENSIIYKLGTFNEPKSVDAAKFVQEAFDFSRLAAHSTTPFRGSWPAATIVCSLEFDRSGKLMRLVWTEP